MISAAAWKDTRIVIGPYPQVVKTGAIKSRGYLDRQRSCVITTLCEQTGRKGRNPSVGTQAPPAYNCPIEIVKEK